MHVTEMGAVFTFIVPAIILCRELFVDRPLLFKAWLAFLPVCLLAGRTPGRPFKPYVNIIFPFYFWLMPLGLLTTHPLMTIFGVYVAFVAKVGVCMSVCFHRYAAHQAFRCGPMMRSVICTLGCLANQGGPIWWASKHRCHHSHCDRDRDPHSAVQDGDTAAFCFFDNPEHKWVDEDFVPRYLEALSIRLIDTFAIVPVMCELALAYWLGGADALWVAAVSGQVSQVLSLWFNIVNHPDDHHEDDAAAERAGKFGGAKAVCIAADKYVLQNTPGVLFSILNRHLWVAALNGEDAHGHHHHFSTLAQRPGLDLPYYYFVRPLCALGLISDAKLLMVQHARGSPKGNEAPARSAGGRAEPWEKVKVKAG